MGYPCESWWNIVWISVEHEKHYSIIRIDIICLSLYILLGSLSLCIHLQHIRSVPNLFPLSFTWAFIDYTKVFVYWPTFWVTRPSKHATNLPQFLINYGKTGSARRPNITPSLYSIYDIVFTWLEKQMILMKIDIFSYFFFEASVVRTWVQWNLPSPSRNAAVLKKACPSWGVWGGAFETRNFSSEWWWV